MISVHPTKPRGPVMKYIMWLPVLIQTYWLHPTLGLSYAKRWADDSLQVYSVLSVN